MSTSIHHERNRPSKGSNHARLIQAWLCCLFGGLSLIHSETAVAQGVVEIVEQPSSLTLLQGDAAAFSVKAIGTPPLFYQWRLNGVDLSKAKASTYIISNAQPVQAGGYDVIVGNKDGSVTSKLATLTVLEPVTIFPTSLIVTQWDSASFGVKAQNNSVVSYQWQQNGVDVPGQTNKVFTIEHAQPDDQGLYRVNVSHGGRSILSDVATLKVLLPPLIITQPKNLTATAGAAVTFCVGATGSAPLGYLWRFDGETLAAGTNSTFTLVNVQSSNAGPYYVLVTNAIGLIFSAIANLTVNAPPSITRQPTNLNVPAGCNAILSVEVAPGALSQFQWRLNGTDIPGATNATYPVANVQAGQGGDYSVLVSNVVGSVLSSNATLSVSFPPHIAKQPADQSLRPGGSATFSVGASGGQPLVYSLELN